MKNSFITVYPSVLHLLDISLNEYVVLDSIYYYQTHPFLNVSGWGKVSYQELAEITNLTKRTLIELCKRLVHKNLLILNGELKQTTEKWYESAYPNRK